MNHCETNSVNKIETANKFWKWERRIEVQKRFVVRNLSQFGLISEDGAASISPSNYQWLVFSFSFVWLPN